MSVDFVQDIMPENIGERHVACVLCVDVSGSMSGDPIRELNQGLVEFGDALQADPMACGRAEVAIVGFDTNAYIVTGMTPASQYVPPVLSTGGTTAMNAAIDLGLDMIEDRKATYKAAGISYYRPWLFVLTDGYPNDSDEGARVKTRLQDYIRNKKVVYMPMGIGTGANKKVLQSYYPDEYDQSKKIVLQANQNHFKEAFQWLSASISVVSNSNPQISDEVTLPALPTGIVVGI